MKAGQYGAAPSGLHQCEMYAGALRRAPTAGAPVQLAQVLCIASICVDGSPEHASTITIVGWREVALLPSSASTSPNWAFWGVHYLQQYCTPRSLHLEPHFGVYGVAGDNFHQGTVDGIARVG